MSEKAHRIPEDFTLTDERRDYALKYKRTNPDDLFADFYEYWLNKQGLQAKKLNWHLAWQTWVRKDAKWNPPKEAPITSQPMKVTPRVVARADILDAPEKPRSISKGDIDQLRKLVIGSLKTLQ